jgi:L,D-transpeptidase catalytic domain/Putative peptidoglycan binding domain/PKD domain
VRPALASAVVLLALGLGAAAAPPTISILASVTEGPAPLHVLLTANGEAASYHWDFGDGGSADGKAVEHDYGGGRFTTVLTATSASGEMVAAQIVITAYAVTLDVARSPVTRRYGVRTSFRGRVVPAEKGLHVALVGPGGVVGQTRSRANGSYLIHGRIRMPGPYFARSDRASGSPLSVVVVPKLITRLVGSGARGSRYELVARVLPRAAGTLAVSVDRRGRRVIERAVGASVRLKLDTRRLTTYRISVKVANNQGYMTVVHRLTARVVLRHLGYGGRGPAVAHLAASLRRLHYAAPATDVFGGQLLDAVYAFQKVHRLPRTGIVDRAFWKRLDSAHTPLPGHTQPPDHLEIDKERQVLYVVRGGRVALIVPVSTAGIAGYYTPSGQFAIYRKVVGFDPSPLGTLYDPMYFTGGYAIHGNPSVPPYPASHGCVRVPMWIAPHLYATNPYGETVYVY